MKLSDRERLFFALGISIGSVIGAAAWWLHFSMIRFAAGG